MKATIANMKSLLRDGRQAIGLPGVVAYSQYTGETCSAAPGDYWFLNDDDCLKDRDGNEMVLVEPRVEYDAANLEP